ncbi:peptidylprolyl isomerase [uncultured Sphingomonas sp.]|uniref:peptidylprolyl isomerase n=1 Tax=uncultured Sphingomonas sp. TaxID=158754 RepID=UPI0035C95912
MRFILVLFAAVFALVGIAIAGPAMAQKKPAIDPQIAARPAPPPITDKENLLYLDLSTGGRVVIWLRPDVAPKMVERIKTLTRQHFYDGLTFHRVIEGFMAQTGDPKGDGTGGSPLPDVPAEFNWLPHVRGAVSAAREGAPPGADAAARTKAENSANSQFFIVFQPNLGRLDRKYTVFGRVISGMEYVDAIQRGEPPTNPSRILHAYVAADNPPLYVAPPAPVPTVAPAIGDLIAKPASVPTVKPAPVKRAAKRK